MLVLLVIRLLGWLLSICLLFGCMFRWLVFRLCIRLVVGRVYFYVGCVVWSVVGCCYCVGYGSTYIYWCCSSCGLVSPALFTCIVLSGMVTVPGYSVHVAVAVLVMVVPAIVAVIGAVNVSVAVCPLVRLVIVHMPVVGCRFHWLVVRL